MNTKSILFVTLLVLSAAGLRAQASVDPAIRSALDLYIEHSNAARWSEAFDLLYDKLFAQVSREELIGIMENMEREGMSLMMSNVVVKAASTPVEEGAETFIRVDYTADVDVRITPGSMFDSPEAIKGLQQQFDQTYGGKNVKWDAADKTFRILARKAMMAIAQQNVTGWKLAEINTDQPQVMAFIFPQSVLDALVNIN